jgi:hypothetical protein
VSPQHTPSTALLSQWQQLIAPARASCRQERSWQRLLVLSCGLLSALGRHTLAQVITTIGSGDADWSPWYRLFNTARVDWETAQQQVLAAVVAELPATAPLTLALDATQLPRTSRRMAGVGWAPQPRTPVWKRGIHLAHRWAGLSVLLPRSAAGDSRALPLRFLPAPTPRATPLAGYPPRREWEAAVQQVWWLRQQLDALGQPQRAILAVGDAAYASAQLRRQLPPQTVLLCRCQRNRALWALPDRQPARGRKRRYGERLLTPHAYGLSGVGFGSVRIGVRGRRIRLRVRVVGPVLIRPAAEHPLYLLVVRGFNPRQPGRQRHREAPYLLVDAAADGAGGWRLPMLLAELLTVAWQRWEVEVMHRELKSGFGLGQQQQWSPAGLVNVVQWICWLYATLVLAAYRAWGYQPPGPHRLGRWWQPRRWSLATLWQALRAAVWQLAEFLPVWARSLDRWGEIAAWFAAPDNPLSGYRRI